MNERPLNLLLIAGYLKGERFLDDFSTALPIAARPSN